MRKFILAANWKMHKNPREAAQFFDEFQSALGSGGLGKGANGGEKQVVVFVPAFDLMTAAECTRGSKIAVGAQNVHFEVKGAFTGENSPIVAREIGASWALVGHSERRSLFHETDEETAKKMKAASAAGLSAMLCVGETLAEREAGKTMAIVERQLTAGLAALDMKALATGTPTVAIAYEPVWAIGTGKVATPEQASEVHQFIRSRLTKSYGNETAGAISILYGGSVKPDNAKAIGAQKDIDGFLVGGASLEASSFRALL